MQGEDDLVAVGSWEANVTGRWPDFPEALLRVQALSLSDNFISFFATFFYITHEQLFVASFLESMAHRGSKKLRCTWKVVFGATQDSEDLRVSTVSKRMLKSQTKTRRSIAWFVCEARAGCVSSTALYTLRFTGTTC